MELVYAFPEPLPLDRARGLQAVSSVAALCRQGFEVTLLHVPGDGEDPFSHYGVIRPPGLRRVAMSRNLPWPMGRVHSNRIFHYRMRRWLHASGFRGPIMVRHVKLAHMLVRDEFGPVLYEAHEVFADTVKPSGRSRYLRLEGEVARRASALVANSGWTAERLTQLYPGCGTITVIPNGVERPVELPGKPWGDAARHVIYAGSFFPWKGVDELLQAAQMLPGYRITLVGGSTEQITSLRQRVGTGAEVRFPGRLAHPAVLDLLAGSCIAVLPNRADTDSSFTSPIKLFEYMAAGCAIVSSDIPAIREILGEEDAIWCKPGDPQSLARAISVLGDNPERARILGERARRRSSEFTWDARAHKLAGVIAKMRL